MLKITPLVTIFLLMSAGNSFGMEKIPKPEFFVLEDGFKWKFCTHWKHFEDFTGKVVVWEPEDQRLRYDAYITDDLNEVPLSMLGNRPWSLDKTGYRLYKCNPPMGDKNIFCTTGDKIAMRLLTLAEASEWSLAVKNKKVVYPQESIWQGITLDNLMPDERKKYCRKQLLKTFWAKQRLLHIGQKDSGSQLSYLSKDILKIIVKYFFSAEVNNFVEKNPRMVLELDEKDSKSELP